MNSSLLALAAFLVAFAPPDDPVRPDPAAELKQRTYCLESVGNAVAAGATYGVVFYPAPGEVVGPSAQSLPLGHKEGGVMLPDSVNDLLYRGNVLFAAHGPAGISGLVRRDDGTFVRFWWLETPGAAMALSARGTTMAVALGTMGLGLCRILPSSELEFKTTIDTAGYAHDVAAVAPPDPAGGSDLFVWVANGRGGIAGLQLDEEHKVTASRTLALTGDVRTLLPHKDGLLFSRGTEGICFVNAALDQATLACLPNRDMVRSLAADKDRVFAADGGEGLMVVDWSDPARPLLKERLHPTGSVNRITIVDRLLYMALDYAGVAVYSLDALPL